MSIGFIVTGTDTGVGKTVFAAALVAALGGRYWKPVQAGLTGETDTDTVMRLAGIGSDDIVREVYRLRTPASPHVAAEHDGLEIDPARLTLPSVRRPALGAVAPQERPEPPSNVVALKPRPASARNGLTAVDGGGPTLPSRPLVIEGAGGLLVPLNRQTLQIDLFESWAMPVVLVARTTLGTINHTLLSIEALRRRNMMVQGVVFVGDHNDDSESAILNFGRVRRLGRLPNLDPLDAASLKRAFELGFDIQDFRR